MRRTRKPAPPKRRNPLARLVRTPGFQKKVEPSVRSYRRKAKHPKPPPEPDA